MTQEDKQLLLQDLSSRLPHGVKVSLQYGGKQLNGMLDAVYPTEERVIVDELSEAIAPIDVKCGSFILDENNITPYLRPMSSMTEEENKKRIELGIWRNSNIKGCKVMAIEKNVNEALDWLNSRHFDYRGLLARGLALEAPGRYFCSNSSNGNEMVERDT